MTRFGKLLVVFNLGLALMLAAWSFSIYANSIDWATPKTGQFAIRAAKLDELWKGVAPVQADWLSARQKLANEETHLVAERVWYDQQLHYVLNGPAKGKGIGEIAVAAKDDPNTRVQKGQILLDDKGNPLLVPPRDPMNNPLQLLSLKEYNDEDKDLLRSIQDVMDKNEKQIEEANKLTDLIIGDKAKGIRGFQQRINDEQAKNAALLAEMELVRPQWINTLVEAQLVNKRHVQMKKRIEELKKWKVASK
jgi:hypothetical protein